MLASAALSAQIVEPIIQTFAGADYTFQGEGKPAVKSSLGSPTDVSVASSGNLLITDQLQFREIGRASCRERV